MSTAEDNATVEQVEKLTGRIKRQLREADRGTWRVEITDKEGNIFKILRFSITD